MLTEFTTNALASLTGRDRAFIQRRLDEAGVLPCRERKQRNGTMRHYRSSEALPAIYVAADLDPNEELARLRKEQADRQEMENRVRRGELVETELILDVVGNEIQNAKATLLGLPRRIAPHCAGKSAGEIESNLYDEIHSCLSELGDHKETL